MFTGGLSILELLLQQFQVVRCHLIAKTRVVLSEARYGLHVRLIMKRVTRTVGVYLYGTSFVFALL
jgi:hypothetical protein